jgi:hypothetical protein
MNIKRMIEVEKSGQRLIEGLDDFLLYDNMWIPSKNNPKTAEGSYIFCESMFSKEVRDEKSGPDRPNWFNFELLSELDHDKKSPIIIKLTSFCDFDVGDCHMFVVYIPKLSTYYHFKDPVAIKEMNKMYNYMKQTYALMLNRPKKYQKSSKRLKGLTPDICRRLITGKYLEMFSHNISNDIQSRLITTHGFFNLHI